MCPVTPTPAPGPTRGGGGPLGDEKGEAPSTAPEGQETLKRDYFPFLRFPQKKRTRKGSRKSDLALVVWTPASPTPGPGQALKSSQSPRGPGARGGRGPAAEDPDPTPELRVPGRPAGQPLASPPQAVPPTRSLRLPRPSREPGRQLHLLPKAQTPAPANTRSEWTRPK